MNRLRAGPGGSTRAGVLTGVIPEGSCLEDPVQAAAAAFEVVFIPLDIARARETAADRDKRMTRILAEGVYAWGSALGQAENYVRLARRTFPSPGSAGRAAGDLRP